MLNKVNDLVYGRGDDLIQIRCHYGLDDRCQKSRFSRDIGKPVLERLRIVYEVGLEALKRAAELRHYRVKQKSDDGYKHKISKEYGYSASCNAVMNLQQYPFFKEIKYW